MGRRAAGLALGTVLVGQACAGAPEEPDGDDGTSASRGPSASGTAQPATSFSVVATGDVLIHPALTAQARRDAAAGRERDYRPLFAGIRPVVSDADLALCHLEVPLGPQGGDFSGYPSFNAPPEVAAALADTGYDTCSTASNHTLDQGMDGVRSTLNTLDDAGVEHTGSARTEQEAATPLIVDAGGVRVGQIAYTYGFNGYPLPDGKPWAANELDVDAAIADARAAREAGAEVVVASVHWGEQYRHEPTSRQRRVAEQLLSDEAIDLVIGHHAHVVQPMEKIDGQWVAYGLGNHVARHAEPRGVSEEGIAVRFRFTRDAGGWSVRNAEYIPTLIELGPPIRLVDLTSVPADPRRRTARERIEGIVLSEDAGADGLTQGGT